LVLQCKNITDEDDKNKKENSGCSALYSRKIVSVQADFAK
jgi:hypothetical protein